MAGSVTGARTLKQGSVELVIVEVTEDNGLDISSDVFVISHVPDARGVQPGIWETPDPTFSGPGATVAVRRLAKLVTGVIINAKKTRYRVFAKVTDSPEDIIVDCGTYDVLV